MTAVIYTITNTVNGRVYVGSTTSLERRWTTHRAELKSRRHHCKSLQEDANKYGLGVFEFKAIEQVDEIHGVVSMFDREAYWAKELNATYNAQGILGGRANSTMPDGLTTFDDFRYEVGASAYLVRIAIEVLGIKPVYQARRTLYPRASVEQVRDYLDKRARGEA